MTTLRNRETQQTLVHVEHDQESLASILMRQGPGRQSMARGKASIMAFDNETLAAVDAIEFDYMKNPPSIMDPKANLYKEEKANNMDAVQSYWKAHAKWLECWPGTEEGRNHIKAFKQEWGSSIRNSDTTNDPTGIAPRAYINVCNRSVAIRSKPTQESRDKTGDVVRPGELVVVDCIVENGGHEFLRISGRPEDNPGWLFDRIDGKPVMMEAKALELEHAWYNSLSKSAIPLHKAPSLRKDTLNGLMLGPFEVFVIDMRCKIGQYNFVHLVDGRGWIYENRLRKEWFNETEGEANDQGACHKETTATACRKLSKESPAEDTGESRYVPIVERLEKDAHGGRHSSMVPPTVDVVKTGLWPYTVGEDPVLVLGEGPQGSVLKPGEVVKVDKICTANGDPKREGSGVKGRLWYRLYGRDGNGSSDSAGWVPATSVTGKQLLFKQDGEASYPSWYTKDWQADDAPREDWMAGVV